MKSGVARWRRALCLSNDERDSMAGTLACYRSLKDDWQSGTEASQKRLAAGRWFEAALGMLQGMEPALAQAVVVRVKQLAGTEAGIAPEPLLTGEDLIEAGFRPGPAFKALLELIYDAQLEGRVRTKAEAMELARRSSV
jgi:hypothetical protein